jgi:hypothetical protein
MNRERAKGVSLGRIRARHENGFVLAELAICVILLLAAMAITVKILAWVGAERRAADRRQWALAALANSLERISAEPFDRVSDETAGAILRRSLSPSPVTGSESNASVEFDASSPVPAKRVSVRVRWKNRYGEWDAPVVLTSWVYRMRKAS